MIILLLSWCGAVMVLVDHDDESVFHSFDLFPPSPISILPALSIQATKYLQVRVTSQVKVGEEVIQPLISGDTI